MRCCCCLKETENDFCRTCSRKLFGLNRFGAKLDFALPDIAQTVNSQGRRISISGAQPKYSLKIENKKLQVTDRNGAYILKPVTDMQFRLYADLPANEHVTMLMARQIFKLEVADCALLSFSAGEYAYVTKRFDVRDDGTRIHQEDFAQIAGISSDTHGSDYKYDSISYEEIAKLMEQHVSAYAVDAEKFFRLVLYNYLVCNGDAHIKNFSLYSPDQEGVYRLTPAYDLINTSLHADDARTACDLFIEKDDYESASLSMKYTCIRAVGMDPTLIISWWSQLFTIRFMPDRRMTSCSWCLRSFTSQNLGMNTLISRPISCVFAGK